MRLQDFQVSTTDLSGQLQLFIETPTQAYPVTDLRVAPQQLILASGTGKPLTLEQWRARVVAIDPQVTLYLQHEQTKRLFGYRLLESQLLLG